MRQAKVQGAITTTDRRLGVVETRLQELNLSSNNDIEDNKSSDQANNREDILR